uniref:DHHA1 domain-containing protein n=1 Tax=Deinococcus phoenicis TaxID=1476583 RepID=UPI000556B87E
EASEYLSGVYREARTLAQSFSTSVESLPQRIAALGAERDALRAEALDLRTRLAGALADAAPLEDVAGVPLRVLTLDDPAFLSGALAATPEGEVRVALAPEGRCGIGSGRADVPAGDLLRAALGVTGGKGGGRPTLAQGSTERPGIFLDAVRGALRSLSSA